MNPTVIIYYCFIIMAEKLEMFVMLFAIIVIIIASGLVSGRSYFTDLKKEHPLKEPYCNGSPKSNNCGAGMFSENACVKETPRKVHYQENLPIGYMKNIGHTGLGQIMCSSELQQKFQPGDPYGKNSYGACVDGTNNVFDKSYLVY